MSWRRCSGCKSDIDFGAPYWVCSVSTCTRKRTGMFFCSVPCWEAHLPMMRHREAYAVEKRAPSQSDWQRQQAAEAEAAAAPSSAGSSGSSTSTSGSSASTVRRRVAAPAAVASNDDVPREILVVVSKLKKYIKAKSGMNTSETLMMPLSDQIRRICDRAINTAAEDGRKTVMDRDLERY